MLDINQGISEISITEVEVGTYEDYKDNDIIIITAGKNRKLEQVRKLVNKRNRLKGIQLILYLENVLYKQGQNRFWDFVLVYIIHIVSFFKFVL